MARRKISIDNRIERQKLVVSKAKDRYEAELEQLNQLVKNVMSYVIKSCFRLSSIAIVHLRKSWTSSAPMTLWIKPESHRQLIFQEVHNMFIFALIINK